MEKYYQVVQPSSDENRYKTFKDLDLLNFFKIIKKCDSNLLEEKSKKYSFNFVADDFEGVGNFCIKNEKIDFKDVNTSYLLNKKRNSSSSYGKNLEKVGVINYRKFSDSVNKDILKIKSQPKNLFKTKLKNSLKNLTSNENLANLSK